MKTKKSKLGSKGGNAGTYIKVGEFYEFSKNRKGLVKAKWYSQKHKTTYYKIQLLGKSKKTVELPRYELLA